MRVLVTGGAGFIGSCFVRLAVGQGLEILNFDHLTYAGNLNNVSTVADHPLYRFVRADIADEGDVERAFAEFQPEAVVHFAAESHVDRSILSPLPVIRTNVNGTFTLLEAARRHNLKRFVHVSTDEVYGDLEAPLEATESFPLKPSSPYSASKASSDLLALSYHRTFGLPVVVTRASNNYGPYQFPEKLIPLMIVNALDNQPLPVYGDGQQIRDWLYVEDHCRGILAVLSGGTPGTVYNIGGTRSVANLDVIRLVLKILNKPESLLRHVTDRVGHDRRYALSSERIASQLGWKPQMNFEDGLAATVAWYQDNQDWVAQVRSGEYRAYYESNYGHRAAAEIRP